MSANKNERFLQVNKEYFGLGLKSIDLLIISQIDEFERTTGECYVTNEQFSVMFGESVSTIKRAMDRLEDLNIIKRDTTFVQGFGRANRQRVLSVQDRKKWKVQNEPSTDNNDTSKIMEGSNITMEGSNVDNGRFKNDEWKVHNEPIKEKENKSKRKVKDNLEKNISYNNLSNETKESIHSFYFWSGKDLERTKRQYKQIPEDIIKRIVEEGEAAMPYN